MRNQTEIKKKIKEIESDPEQQHSQEVIDFAELNTPKCYRRIVLSAQLATLKWVLGG
jgi:hypothetical protein